MWNSSASKAASKQDYLTVCYNRTTDFGAQFKLARLEWFTCIDQVTLVVNKMESLKQFLNTSFTGEMGDYLTSSESTNSRHDCINDDLLSLPIQKYAEIFQAHQAHVTSFLWYRLSVFWWRKILIPFSGRKVRSNQNVHERWIFNPTWRCEQAKHWHHPSLWTVMHMIWNWEWFQEMHCRNDSADLRKDLGNWSLRGHA